MLKTKDILDEKDKRLRLVSKDVVFPLTDKDKKIIDEMIEYLVNSQIDELAEKYDLRPGMGMSAIQVGVNKRYFVIVYEVDPEETDNSKRFETYIVVNPKIISNSMEKIYVDMGEGCLSVNRDVEGIVPRYARVTVEYFDENGQKKTTRAREELAIAFQHEIDHLNGILFTDHIDKNNPYKGQNEYRAI